MRARLLFLKLQWKKYNKAAPVILLECLIFAILILAFGCYAANTIYGKTALNSIQIGIVSEEENSVTQMLAGFVESMDSFQERCNFQIMEEDKAKEALQNGEIYAAVFLPEGTLEGILNGTNIPARVVLGNAGSSMETMIFEEVAKAGGRLLSTAQAGIYAADDFCLKLGQKDKIRETEDFLNQAYLDYALNRTAVFKLKEVNATGALGATTYYGASLLLVFLSLFCVILGKDGQITPSSLSDLLVSRGIGYFTQYGVEMTAFSVVFAIFGCIIGTPVLAACMKLEGMGGIDFSCIAVFFLVLLLIGIFIRMLLEMTGSSAGGIGVCFIVLLLLMLVSGLLLPSAFLPLWMEKISVLSPYSICLKTLFAVMEKEDLTKLLLLLGGLTVVFFLIGALAFRSRKWNFSRDTQSKGKWVNIRIRGIWGILCKQYFMRHRIWFLFLIAAALFMVIWSYQGKSEEIQGIRIGILAEDEKGEQLFERLKAEEEAFRFQLFESEEEMLRQVKSGVLECAYVLPDGFFEKMANGKIHRQIQLYYSPGSTAHKLSYEVVFSQLFVMLSESVLEEWAVQSEIEEVNELIQQNEVHALDGSTFSFVFERIGTKAQEGAAVLDPIRGCVAVIIFLFSLLGLGNYCDLREKVDSLPKSAALKMKEVSLHIAIAGAILSGLFLLVVSGCFQYENWEREIAGLLFYFVLLEMEMRILSLISRTSQKAYSIIPILLIGCILFSPVFIQIKTYIPAAVFIEKLFPTTWYLRLFL